MYLNVSTGGTIFSSFDIETMERRPSPVSPPPTVAKQNARKHHAFRLERRARARPSEHLVPPALQRPSGACASGEAHGGAQAPSDVKVALGTALVAVKSALAAVLVAQLTEENRSAQIVAMPAWTSYGEQYVSLPGHRITKERERKREDPSPGGTQSADASSNNIIIFPSLVALAPPVLARLGLSVRYRYNLYRFGRDKTFDPTFI